MLKKLEFSTTKEAMEFAERRRGEIAKNHPTYKNRYDRLHEGYYIKSGHRYDFEVTVEPGGHGFPRWRGDDGFYPAMVFERIERRY